MVDDDGLGGCAAVAAALSVLSGVADADAVADAEGAVAVATGTVREAAAADCDAAGVGPDVCPARAKYATPATTTAPTTVRSPIVALERRGGAITSASTACDAPVEAGDTRLPPPLRDVEPEMLPYVPARTERVQRLPPLIDSASRAALLLDASADVLCRIGSANGACTGVEEISFCGQLGDVLDALVRIAQEAPRTRPRAPV